MDNLERTSRILDSLEKATTELGATNPDVVSAFMLTALVYTTRDIAESLRVIAQRSSEYRA